MKYRIQPVLSQDKVLEDMRNAFRRKLIQMNREWIEAVKAAV